VIDARSVVMDSLVAQVRFGLFLYPRKVESYRGLGQRRRPAWNLWHFTIFNKNDSSRESTSNTQTAVFYGLQHVH
jgi:hypothetical protein